MRPAVVSYGGGVNSTALLVGLFDGPKARRPDAILFADTGGATSRNGERPATYAYIADVVAPWLAERGAEVFRIWASTPGALDHGSLFQECINNRTLPALAFGFRGCSVKWKRQVMDRWVKSWHLAREAWARHEKVDRLIGIHAGEAHRGLIPDDRHFSYHRPLVEWGWDQEECERQIFGAGLPLPPKSACYFCPAMKKAEVIRLAEEEPALFAQAVAMERNFLEGPNYRADEPRSTKGLGRHWSWEQLVEDHRGARPLPTIEAGVDDCLCEDGGDA